MEFLLLLKHWNKLGKTTLSEMVFRDVCLNDTDTSITDGWKLEINFEISRCLTYIIAYLADIQTQDKNDFDACAFIFEILLGNIKSWKMNEKLDHVLILLFLLSARQGSFEKVGLDLLDGLEEERSSNRELYILEMFYRFLCGELKYEIQF